MSFIKAQEIPKITTEKMEERYFTDFTTIVMLRLPEESNWSVNFLSNYRVFFALNFCALKINQLRYPQKKNVRSLIKKNLILI